MNYYAQTFNVDFFGSTLENLLNHPPRHFLFWVKPQAPFNSPSSFRKRGTTWLVGVITHTELIILTEEQHCVVLLYFPGITGIQTSSHDAKVMGKKVEFKVGLQAVPWKKSRTPLHYSNLGTLQVPGNKLRPLSKLLSGEEIFKRKHTSQHIMARGRV